MRIGDTVRVDGFDGLITGINARYTVVRGSSGRESIVPNEMFISSRVENLSLSDTRVLQSLVLSVGYDSDTELVLRLLSQAALAQKRVLRQPEVSVYMTNFGVDGLEFTLNYWISDLQNSQQSLRSAIGLEILSSLRAHHIEMAYPQRVLHTRSKGEQAASLD